MNGIAPTPIVLPLWILDWNVLQGLPADSTALGSHHFLLLETAVLEVTGKQTSQRTGLFQRLISLIDRAQFTIQFGGNVIDIFETQRRLDRHLAPEDLIVDISSVVPSVVGVLENADVSKILLAMREHPRFCGMEQLRVDWVRSCESLAIELTGCWKSEHELREMVEDDHKLASFLHDRSIYAEFAIKKLSQFVLPKWHSLLREKPCDFAVGRWAKICLYYALRLTKGETRKFANNFDDAQYLLAATYTGYLTTGDSGLQRATRIVFPGVNLWNPKTEESHEN